MQPIGNPHEHDRQYPSLGPPLAEREPTMLEHPIMPYLTLALMALLGLWGLLKVGDAGRGQGRQAFGSVAYGESSSGVAAQVLEPSESGLRPVPVGEPLIPSSAEQELSRTLAELDSEMSRTKRLAERVGQEEAYFTLEVKHEILTKAVAKRSVPWSESDRVDLDRQTRTLKAELKKFSDELEEVASVRL